MVRSASAEYLTILTHDQSSRRLRYSFANQKTSQNKTQKFIYKLQVKTMLRLLRRLRRIYRRFWRRHRRVLKALGKELLGFDIPVYVTAVPLVVWVFCTPMMQREYPPSYFQMGHLVTDRPKDALAKGSGLCLTITQAFLRRGWTGFVLSPFVEDFIVNKLLR